MAPVKLIIDTDPGVDDILGIALALNSPEADVKLISLCFGNIDVKNSLRNTITMFHILEQEKQYRIRKDLPVRHHANQKPLVSVGLDASLDGTRINAAYYHGYDGLGNVHTHAPHHTPPEVWRALFDPEHSGHIDDEEFEAFTGFVPSKNPSYIDILNVLREEEENTVVICAIGPLQNIAKAAEFDPKTFARVKEIVVMGGAINEHGNVTPLAEFNAYSDPVASARVYALSSPNPSTTLPPNSPESLINFPKQLKVTLFPLDITHRHGLFEKDYRPYIDKAIAAEEPFAIWASKWLDSTFKTSARLSMTTFETNHLEMHDPLAMFYAITSETLSGWKLQYDVDIRVETTGQWTRGATIVDKRGRARLENDDSSDDGNWLGANSGNRCRVCIMSPTGFGPQFGIELLDRVFGSNHK
ncbi:nucleoside hydrolase [Nadsonia fulvescens var. elongata DSM 6958]|uniref:Nucleoside hydrolase n=1 Tax=Nadsonia fulvescens var. elongata DSM 6958 TaxID=857566 RepID=A0A1E3PT68_9ASCO|nr:nucleoside hydrolase [Nadsonia fulvescens var. elongata DSM 6958]